MEHLDFPGSQLCEKYNVWFYEKLWKKKKRRRLKQLELTGYCSLECPLTRDAGVYSSAVACWFWECVGHKSSAVVTPAPVEPRRVELIPWGAVSVVRSRTIRLLTLCDLGVKAHGSRCFGVCVFVGGQLRRVWTVSQTPASDLLSSKFVHKARKMTRWQAACFKKDNFK